MARPAAPPETPAPRVAPEDELRLAVEWPQPIADGAAVAAVRGGWLIAGWALARSGVAAVAVSVDGAPFGTASYGIPRRDIAEAFPGWAGAGDSGFSLVVGAGVLAPGRHLVGVELQARSGRRRTTTFSVEIAPPAESGGPAMLRRKLSLAEIQVAEGVLAGLGWYPQFALLIGIGEIDQEVAEARRTLASLREQVYGAWHATVVRRGRVAPDNAAARLLEGFDDIAERIAVRLDVSATARLTTLARSPAPGGTTDLIGVLLAGDVLGADALLETVIASGLHPDAEFFYSDERRTDPASGQGEAFFKPQWSPDLLTSTNYVGRFWCTLPSVFSRARITMGEWFQFGDYDLVLRCTEATAGIHHIAKLLCERGRPQLDHPDQERAALGRALHRRGIRGAVRDTRVAGQYRIERAPAGRPLVSIIIPTCAAQGLVKICIESLRATTAYRNFQIVCVDNIPATEPAWKTWVRDNADLVVAAAGPFNWSRFNNLGAQAANGEYLLFLNDDVEIVEPGWLDALLAHAARPEVGAVGARLLYPDGTVQHAGIFWTPRGGRHAFRHVGGSDPGWFGMALAERNVLAVTGACLMVRRSDFTALGGFDERHAIVNNDVDYCLRCWEAGKAVVYTPHATLVHYEGASRSALGDAFDAVRFAARWGRRLRACDPFHHPMLSRDRDDLAADPEPLEFVYAGRPLFDPAEIRNILAVKLDHIGDFVTAVPALRELQRRFPQAKVYLLAAPASAALADLVPGLAGVLQFEFFFARSGLGQRDLRSGELAALRERLAAYRFDLAIDLRAAPETRPVLQFTGARWLAGFDHDRQFPWLDIVAAWESDHPAVRKRAHMSDNLLRLVDAVARAAQPLAVLAPPLAGETQPEAARPGPRRRRVCIHPGVGSRIRQWPAAHFAALIDLLVASHDVEIVLVGSADEETVAREILETVERADAVRSLVGKTPLWELPKILAPAVLFIGNNSGPQHLAAVLGVPTVAIHSGTVDAREWGPSGINAVAIRKNMVCSPCYLSDRDTCPRHLACLTEVQPHDVYAVCHRFLAIEAVREEQG